MRISLNGIHPHLPDGYEFCLQEGVFYNPHGRKIGSKDDKYYRMQTQIGDKYVKIKRAEAVYWYWMGLPDNYWTKKGAHRRLQVIDHINRNRLDDRISNLRLVSASENMYNKAASERLKDPNFIAEVRAFADKSGPRATCKKYRIGNVELGRLRKGS